MSNFDQAERETRGLNFSQTSASQRDTNFSKKKMDRKITATFTNRPERSPENIKEVSLDKISDDQGQDQLFINSMMLDNDSSMKQ